MSFTDWSASGIRQRGSPRPARLADGNDQPPAEQLLLNPARIMQENNRKERAVRRTVKTKQVVGTEDRSAATGVDAVDDAED
jgi:hypothetical protein